MIFVPMVIVFSLATLAGGLLLLLSKSFRAGSPPTHLTYKEKWLKRLSKGQKVILFLGFTGPLWLISLIFFLPFILSFPSSASSLVISRSYACFLPIFLLLFLGTTIIWHGIFIWNKGNERQS